MQPSIMTVYCSKANKRRVCVVNVINATGLGVDRLHTVTSPAFIDFTLSHTCTSNVLRNAKRRMIGM